ncbi:MAG: prephenate dehydratase [Bacteroidota bacterium]
MKKQIAIQGIKGSFHHEAANHVFGKDIELSECHTFDKVIQQVISKEADYGVMAIENSLAGCIIPNYNLIRASQLDVCGEVGIRVRLNLLGLKGVKAASLTELRSHQMALRQCATFLNGLDDVRVVEAFDTAGSAKEIADGKLSQVGAIAGKLAASEYGLEVLSEGIEDHELNYTRFLVLKHSDQARISKSSNKLSIYFETSHDPGSLAKLLSVISGLGLNLSKLQSYPVPSKNTHYGFFATLEFQEEKQVDHLKILLDSMTIVFEILGTYEKGQTYG